ncbi:MAG TPA: CAP domain-containing protein [bacterium]|nr:CAP domain-containing protein [bacterium]
MNRCDRKEYLDITIGLTVKKRIPARVPVLCILLLAAGSFALAYADQKTDSMSPNRFIPSFLEQRLLHHTNQARRRHGIPPLTLNDTLRTAAQKHSREMAALQYLSHTSPVSGREHLRQRVETEQLKLNNTLIGENIGVDFFLHIANIPYYIEEQRNQSVYIAVETGRIIGYQNYDEFAEKMVNAWLASPGHRENLLNPVYREIGIGAAPGPYTDLDAVYITQVFKGPLGPEDRGKYHSPHFPGYDKPEKLYE